MQKSDARLWATLQPIVHNNPTLKNLYEAAKTTQNHMGGVGGASHRLMGAFFLAHVGADANALYKMTQDANIDPKEITAFATSTLAKDAGFVYAATKTLLTPSEKLIDLTKANKGNPFYQRAFSAWSAGVAVGEFSKLYYLNNPDYVTKRKASGATDQDLLREGDIALRKGVSGTLSAGTFLASKVAWPVALADVALTAVIPGDDAIAKGMKARGLDPKKNPFDGIGSASSVVSFLAASFGIEAWKRVENDVLEIFRNHASPTKLAQEPFLSDFIPYKPLFEGSESDDSVKGVDPTTVKYLKALAEIIADENTKKIREGVDRLSQDFIVPGEIDPCDTNPKIIDRNLNTNRVKNRNE